MTCEVPNEIIILFFLNFTFWKLTYFPWCLLNLLLLTVIGLCLLNLVVFEYLLCHLSG